PRQASEPDYAAGGDRSCRRADPGQGGLHRRRWHEATGSETPNHRRARRQRIPQATPSRDARRAGWGEEETMSSPLEKMVRWIRALEKTAREASSPQELRGFICREHFDCIRVVCGPLNEHVPWQEKDPVTTAQELM